VPVLFLVAVVAVLAGVYLAATGRGGELAYERVDHAPLDLGPVSAPDIAMLRPPTAMWGYNMQVTDEALDLMARAMRDRDVTIAYLQQQLANRFAADPGPPQAGPTWGGPQAFPTAGNPEASEAFPTAGNPDAPQGSEAAKAPGVLVAPLPQRVAEPSATAPSPEAAEPAQATQPSPTLAGSYDVQGPQGAYDTHDWWAEQEEAAREEEARRQAAAQEAGPAWPPEADPPEATAPQADSPEADSPEATAREVDSPYGHTGTVPNPVITSPDDDPLAGAEEQGW
jgi:hypothetical protein